MTPSQLYWKDQQLRQGDVQRHHEILRAELNVAAMAVAGYEVPLPLIRDMLMLKYGQNGQ